MTASQLAHHATLIEAVIQSRLEQVPSPSLCGMGRRE
eukprot:CAMPEP_0184384474 /NCGR_PEP_ID=MMETSP0007-20130409/7917_1 /TAXON_ID=97485 /ORGANISM="Prymnesium parvum, Strain Texoma1" /LENGTH=36 /DNA_ID= /DNA_START= /DNA_END= /DNA_ORIENTATION=